MSFRTQIDFDLEIARGNVPGMSVVNKFGKNALIVDGSPGLGTYEDIWDGGGSYPYPATALITHIHQAANQAAMQGENIEVQGLDASWVLTVQTVALNAVNSSTLVALPTPLRRIFRMKVMTDVVTDEDVEAVNAGDTVIYAIAQAGLNQTLMALYTVPAGYTAYMTNWFMDQIAAVDKEPKAVEFRLWVADRANDYEFQIKQSRGLPKSGPIQHIFKPYMKITEKSDIKIDAASVGEEAMAHAGFDLILIEN